MNQPRGLYRITIVQADGTEITWRDTSRTSAVMYARLHVRGGAARGDVHHIDGTPLASFAARETQEAA